MGPQLFEACRERVLIWVGLGLVVDVGVDFFLATRLVKHLSIEGVLNDAEQLVMLLVLAIMLLLPAKLGGLVA